MVFYEQLQQINEKWNDRLAIIGRAWMKEVLISDENMDKFMTQHHPQPENVACPHATQYLCSIKTRRTHLTVAFILSCIVTKTTILVH